MKVFPWLYVLAFVIAASFAASQGCSDDDEQGRTSTPTPDTEIVITQPPPIFCGQGASDRMSPPPCLKAHDYMLWPWCANELQNVRYAREICIYGEGPGKWEELTPPGG